jgi:hypothetical protein
MKKWINKINVTLVMLFLLFTGSMNANATPEVDEYSLHGKHIKFTINYRYYNEGERLYYKCLLENLDGFIDSLKQRGGLNRGKIHFEIMVAVWVEESIGVEMYRYKNGYYCWLNGFAQPITQDYMTKVIAYFASDNWESFCYQYKEMTPRRALQIFNRRIDTIAVSYQHSDKKVFELNSVAVYFENGSLIGRDSNGVVVYFENGSRANSRDEKDYRKFTKLLPFSAGSKDFVFMDETICAIENNAIISAVKLTKKDYGSCEMWAYVHPKWVNFSTGHARFSYSIEQNKFYRLD